MPDEERTYRRWLHGDLPIFYVRVDESDLLISAERPLPDLAERALRAVRADLEAYLQRDPEFGTAVRPHDVMADAPAVAQDMAEAARRCEVGPMAAVAGAVAEQVGKALLAESRQVIVENGGDIFLHTARPRTAAIFAGSSPLSGRLGVRITRTDQPLGLCTSSGTVGHSLSFGKADAAIVLAGSAALADAAATALGNRVGSASDIEAALRWLSTMPGIFGGAVIIGDHLGAWGEVALTRVDLGDQPRG